MEQVGSMTKPVTGWPIFRLLSRLECPGLWLKGHKRSMEGKGCALTPHFVELQLFAALT